MLIIGYSGSGRKDVQSSKRRLLLLNKLKENRSYYDSFMAFHDDDVEDIPINYFPLKGLGHDCAASLLKDGRVMASVAEERFNRKKHSLSLEGTVMLPKKSFEYCLKKAGKTYRDIDYVCYYLDMNRTVYEKKLTTLADLLPQKLKERVIQSNEHSYAREFSHNKVYENLVRFTEHDWRKDQLVFVPHQSAHAASAFYSSGFHESGILTLDGYGENTSSIFAIGSDAKIKVMEETHIPTSLGILYMVITVFLGFRALNDEYKIMGLASYGNPMKYKKHFESLIRIHTNGQYDTNVLLREDFKDYLKELFGAPREENGEITQREMDIAAALQKATEDCILYRLEYIKRKYDIQRLCMSGGVTLNCALNGKIVKSAIFEDVYVFPAATDDGCSIGAAQYFYHNILQRKNGKKKVNTIYWGPSYDETEIAETLAKYQDQLSFKKEKDIGKKVAELLNEQKVVGWFQGRMEFGPRALGNRSILGDPRSPEMKNIINLKVKKRESFRPFAPAVKHEKASSYFDMTGLAESPFMLFIVDVLPEIREKLPAITHFNGTARIQTVKEKDNKRLWRLLDYFEQMSGVPVLLNTSFNIMGEPIVCSPEDAIKCFLGTNIDALAIEDYLVRKTTMGEEYGA